MQKIINIYRYFLEYISAGYATLSLVKILVIKFHENDILRRERLIVIVVSIFFNDNILLMSLYTFLF